MEDIFDKVVGQKDGVTKLIQKIPGFKGYVERADRRMSDKLLRESISKAFEEQYQRLSAIERDLISNGELSFVDDIEGAAIKIRQFIDRVRTAAYGYAGIFDAIKINENELATVYQYDNYLLSLNETVSNAIDNVEASIGSDGLPAAIKHLTSIAQAALEAFNKRTKVMQGIEK
ncbi:MAG: hypothetical protein VB108_04165 [Anaerolineaceae bacterium]|nr:hypothetical protein [Anaerolineaceae bacterium]